MDLLLIIVLAIGVYVAAWRVLRQRSGTTTVRTEGQVQGPGKFACEVWANRSIRTTSSASLAPD